MQRRSLLKTMSVIGAGLLAGCTASSGVGQDEPTSVEQVEPEIAKTDFEVLDQGCGNQVNEATVAFADDTVEIDGTIAGSDACKTAELADATYDPDAEELRVTVATVDREGADACAQCIVEIEYRATVQFAGGLPPKVSVRHEGAGEGGVVSSVDRLDGGSTTDETVTTE